LFKNKNKKGYMASRRKRKTMNEHSPLVVTLFALIIFSASVINVNLASPAGMFTAPIRENSAVYQLPDHFNDLCDGRDTHAFLAVSQKWYQSTHEMRAWLYVVVQDPELGPKLYIADSGNLPAESSTTKIEFNFGTSAASNGPPMDVCSKAASRLSWIWIDHNQKPLQSGEEEIAKIQNEYG
jgi:hypothetical protein